MLRLIVLLFAVGKLLLLGKWYPPASVRDVSTGDFYELREYCEEIETRLHECERQTEATRKKVYREEVKAEDEKVPQGIVPPAEPLARENAVPRLGAGDEVPAGYL